MALVVEDGSGIADAVSYVDLDYYKAYWSARGVTFTKSDLELEVDLVEGTDWLDGHQYFGQRATTTQRTAFPRKNLIIRRGNPRLDPGSVLDETAIPDVLKEAQCEAARANESERLQREIDEAALLTSKGTGPIKKQYFRPDGRRRLLAVERLIAGLHDDGRRGPSALILRS